MAHLVYWTFSDIPSDLCDILIKDLKKYDEAIEDSTIRDEVGNPELHEGIRKSSNAWINGSNWVAGFVWYYITKANRENFRYNIEGLDSNEIQYTEYKKGEYYDWHVDDDINRCMINDKLLTSDINQGENLAILNGEYIRKLSFSIQLSDPEDYEGGELEFKANNYGSERRGDFTLDDTFFTPNKKGTIIIFDSRVRHRVCEVKSGVRRSLVGWVVGPRWK
jgi:PKHD-type hydroxylase